MDLHFRPSHLTKLTQEKATHRSVQANEAGDFFHPVLMEIAGRQWDKQPRIFVPTAPDADVVLAEARGMIDELWK
jgi:hypothetical protein